MKKPLLKRILQRVLTFFVLLAIGLGGLYFWWQVNAAKIIGEQSRKTAGLFIANAQSLQVTNRPVKTTGLKTAVMPELTLTGHDLLVKDPLFKDAGPRISRLEVVLQDVGVAGPPFDFTGVGGGRYVLTMTEAEANNCLAHQGVLLLSSGIQNKASTVTFSRDNGVTLTGKYAIGKTREARQLVPFTVTGTLAPAEDSPRQVDFTVNTASVPSYRLGQERLKQVLPNFNPVLDVSGWPFASEIEKVEVGDGEVTVYGRITGISQWMRE